MVHYSLIKTLKEFGILKDELINIEGPQSFDWDTFKREIEELWKTADKFNAFHLQPGNPKLSTRLDSLEKLLKKALLMSEKDE